MKDYLPEVEGFTKARNRDGSNVSNANAIELLSITIKNYT